MTQCVRSTSNYIGFGAIKLWIVTSSIGICIFRLIGVRLTGVHITYNVIRCQFGFVFCLTDRREKNFELFFRCFMSAVITEVIYPDRPYACLQHFSQLPRLPILITVSGRSRSHRRHIAIATTPPARQVCSGMRDTAVQQRMPRCARQRLSI